MRKKIGIKNSIRLLTLAVFVLSLISGYFLYNSYTKYQDSKKLLNYISFSNILSNLLINISNEKIESNIYSLTKTPIPYLKTKLDEARKNTDNSITKLLNFKDKEKIKILNSRLLKLYKVRESIDASKKDNIKYFDEVARIILDYQKKALQFSYLKELKAELDVDLSLTKAINRNIIENSIVSFYILLDKPLPEKLYTKMKKDIVTNDVSLPLDALSFDPYEGLNKVLYKVTLDDLVENRKIVDYINLNYYTNNEFYGWTIDVMDWTSVLKKHILELNIIKKNINKFIVTKAENIKRENLNILIISTLLFILTVLLQLASHFIEKGIQVNIDTLSELLNSLARIVGKDTKMDISTNEGQSQAFHIIEDSIKQINNERLRADSSNKAKSAFLANMSHEIRTPINGVMGFIDLLKMTKLDKNQLDYVSTIEISAKNLLLIINQILDISKIEADKMEIYLEDFDPCKEFSDTINIFSAKTYQEKISFVTYIDPNLPKVLKGDVLKLKEILTNLINNAVKFTPREGQISVQILLKRIRNNKAKIYFEVADTGIGMTPDQVKKIFEPFTQADSSTTKKYGGTGLGMTIVSRYIEMMGSQIQVESKYQKGTKFFFNLELDVVDSSVCISDKIYTNIDVLLEDNLGNEYLIKYLEHFGIDYRQINNISEVKSNILLLSKQLDDGGIEYINKKMTKIILFGKTNTKYKNVISTLKSPLFPISLFKGFREIFSSNKQMYSNPFQFKKALIVEDNIVNQKLLEIILNELEIENDIASNGKEALELFIKNRYNFVFMDLSMPVMDGYEATKRIREYEKQKNLKSVPIIALTSNVLEEDRDKFFGVGGSEFLAKPTTQTVLISVMLKIISRSRM